MLLKPLLHLTYICMSRQRAEKLARSQLRFYEQLAGSMSEGQGRKIVPGPLMPGVDRDMTDWSMYMLLAHNAIVNRGITAVVEQLANGEALHGPALMDIKHDVMPGTDCGPEALENFRLSVRDHIDTVRGLGKLRRTRTFPHPMFGAFDAHKWNCMFGVHLLIHNRQARMIAEK
ncbi:MAG: hypothetical protein PF795_11730 [Kiritimatiellae bacterium]|nr:hypothetical protein [Kiritimatiellia bacterium]